MIMKYKDFKMMTNDSMKQVKGGVAAPSGCSTECEDSHVRITTQCIMSGNRCETIPGHAVGCPAEGTWITCDDLPAS